ncbi:hypothetical protein NAP1_09022 [Erythrobacter sp. NAP1]|uniref:hypothetical protein n=1 Tax=Erythrobacter sp. NAP1 TaxID=237727 RepID=UPI000068526B|nr:hypothetical protein [Erythrobacter sp. NAP1]EAQ27723.1 hypothetical protein NAP1_09022 [Erythrobacter sp. NAP1]
MPIGEVFLNAMLVILAFSGVLGLTSMFLSHRREMARIKSGNQSRSAALTHENIELKETVSLMQDRIAVLEQIAVDPARRTADEIEKLR